MNTNKVFLNDEVLIDLSQDTATEEDVAIGKTFHKADGSIGTGVAKVGTVVEKDVNFYDYDGTLLYSYTADEAKNMEELPPLPTQPGLICQEWNHTLEEVKDVDVAMDIGATYITDDGKTRLYIETYINSYSFALTLYSANGVSVLDWGDGSPTETLAANQWSVISHSYTLKGTYIITIEVPEGTELSMGDGTSSSPLIKKINHAYNNINTILKSVELGERTAIRDYGLYYCIALETITVPKLPDNAFYYQTQVGTNVLYGS